MHVHLVAAVASSVLFVFAFDGVVVVGVVVGVGGFGEPLFALRVLERVRREFAVFDELAVRPLLGNVISIRCVSISIAVAVVVDVR